MQHIKLRKHYYAFLVIWITTCDQYNGWFIRIVIRLMWYTSRYVKKVARRNNRMFLQS